MKKGFTLIEIILIIGILSIIAAFSAPIALNIYDRQIVISTSEDVFSVLKKAQADAEYRRGGTSHGVRFLDDDTYVLFRGGSYDGRDSSYDEIYPLYGLTATTSNPVLSETEIVFATGTGAFSATTTLSLSNNGTTKDIRFCDSNVIEFDSVCNPFDVAEFDGVDGYVHSPNSTSLSSGINAVTVAFWIYPTKTGNNSWIDRYDNIANGQWVIGRYSNNIYAWVTDGSNYGGRRSSVTPSLNEWSYVVFTFDAGEVKIYINGQRTDDSDFSSAPTSMKNVVMETRIGKPNGGISGYFDGKIANVAIYNDVRTDTEILADYQNESINTNDANLVSFWPLAGDYLDYAAGAAAGGNDGTPSGGVSFTEDAVRPDSGI